MLFSADKVIEAEVLVLLRQKQQGNHQDQPWEHIFHVPHRAHIGKSQANEYQVQSQGIERIRSDKYGQEKKSAEELHHACIIGHPAQQRPWYAIAVGIGCKYINYPRHPDAEEFVLALEQEEDACKRA